MSPIAAQAQTTFPTPCWPAYAAIASSHPIDAQCGLPGDAPAGAHQLQNRAKNDLCRTGTPITVSRYDFVRLERAAEKAKIAGDIDFGSSGHLPADRTPLQQIVTKSGSLIGEGTVVRHRAFLLHAKAAGNESVNCGLGGFASHDLHLELVQVQDDDPCDSLTAEMIPHFRPDAWTTSLLNSVRAHPVRVTGQLFFDASHVLACDVDPPRGGQPKRLSLWEIHPVYEFDVCKNFSISGCPVDDDSKWVPLDQWEAFEETTLATETDEDE